jgi:hypothetical protein
MKGNNYFWNKPDTGHDDAGDDIEESKWNSPSCVAF